MATLELSGIAKSYGTTGVLRNIDLSIGDGEFIAVVGPSGCGKSTLLRIIAGLEEQDAGTVRIDGTTVDALPPKTRDIAMVFQSYALYPHMTVEQNIALPLVMRDLSRIERLPFARRLSCRVVEKRATIKAEIREAAELVAMEGYLDRKPKQLSGGQRQRVALARALVRKPKLFLLDEPLSNLDAALRTSTRSEIVELQKRLQITTIYVTHDQVEAMTMATRIVVLMEGEVVQIGTAKELYDAPADVRVARFIGSPQINVIPAHVADAVVRFTGDRVQVDRLSAADGGIQLGIRPEHITFIPPRSDTLNGIVRHKEFLGAEELVHVSLGPDGAAPVLMRRHTSDLPSPPVGSSIGLTFAPEKIHVFDASGRRIPSLLTEMSAPSKGLRYAEAPL